jgi:hypothetical protein
LENLHVHSDDRSQPPDGPQSTRENSSQQHGAVEYILLIIAGLCFLHPVWTVSSQWYEWLIYPAAVFSMAIIPIWQVFGQTRFIIQSAASIGSILCIGLILRFIYTGWDRVPIYFLFNAQLGLFAVYYYLALLGFKVQRTVFTTQGRRESVRGSRNKHQYSLAFFFNLRCWLQSHSRRVDL